MPVGVGAIVGAGAGPETHQAPDGAHTAQFASELPHQVSAVWIDAGEHAAQTSLPLEAHKQQKFIVGRVGAKEGIIVGASDGVGAGVVGLGVGTGVVGAGVVGFGVGAGDVGVDVGSGVGTCVGVLAVGASVGPSALSQVMPVPRHFSG